MAKESAQQLRGEVLVRLRECSGALHALGNRFAATAAVHRTDLQALEHLSHQGAGSMTVGELGAALELSSGAVTGLVDRLVEAGHVERVADPADRRRVRLRMTEGAHALADDVFGAYVRRLDTSLQQFTPDELRTVAAFLRAATEATDGCGPAVP